MTIQLQPGKPTMREIIDRAMAEASRSSRNHVPTVYVPDEIEPQISEATRSALIGAAITRTMHGA